MSKKIERKSASPKERQSQNGQNQRKGEKYGGLPCRPFKGIAGKLSEGKEWQPKNLRGECKSKNENQDAIDGEAGETLPGWKYSRPYRIQEAVKRVHRNLEGY